MVGFYAFTNSRKLKMGGDTMIMIRECLPSNQISVNCISDSFNICAVVIGRQLLVVAVYRFPWAIYADTKELCSCLDNLITPYAKLIVVGDFNVPKVN